MKKFGSIFIAMTVIAFGAVSLGSAFIHTYTQLIVTRVFLGIAEGGTLVRIRIYDLMFRPNVGYTLI